MDRPPAVCLPGTLCDARLFAPLIERLPLDASVVGSGDAATVGAWAAAVLATAPERFVAIGFSLGGFAVLELLRHAPHRLRGVVLIASHAHPDRPGNIAERRRQATLLATSGPAALIDDLWPRYVGTAAHQRASLRTTIAAMAEGFDTAAFARQAAIAATRSDSRDDGNPHRVPALVIAGADDMTCPPDRSSAAAAMLGAPLVELSGIGHFAPLEAPDAVAGAVGGWLATLREAAVCC